MEPIAPHDRLLVLMTLNAFSTEEKREAISLAGSVTDWNEFWRVADDNRTAPLVQYNMEKLKIFSLVPKTVRDRFVARSAEIRNANEGRLAVAKKFLKKFNERKIPVVILKGVNFAETIYKNPYYKRMNDIDILIRFADIDAIYDVYEEMGFFCAAELVGGNPRKQEKFSHHAPSFFSRDLKCMIGTHWGLITPMAPYRIDYPAIWSRVRDFKFYNLKVLTMTPEDNLHHLCVHLPYYKAGLKEIADIYNLVRHYGNEIDWSVFLREVAKAKTENPVYHALSLANRLCPVPKFDEIIAAVKPKTSWYFRRDTARKIRDLAILVRMRSVHMARIEKNFSDFNITKKALEKWKYYLLMWHGLLFPPIEDVIKMNAYRDPGLGRRLLGRVITPLKIFRVFSRDLGAKIFILILIKCFVESIWYTLKAPFSRGTEIDYAAFARRIGCSVEDLQRLKDNLE